ncbi:hypothetical protein GCM10023195_88100 [Actinoallomurus liliacearum]|uniref:Uncharacterized protein n=1 Tax=Actinoallomurus liliacearum TaxID=1080073 RepID=A0ABP8U1P3_9ACTN
MTGSGNDRHQPLNLPDWWPKARGYVKFPTDGSLPTASKALDGHLAGLDEAMRYLASEGLVTAEDVGNWDAGQELARTAKTAHGHILEVYREFQRQLAAVSLLLIQQHRTQSEAEEASSKAPRRLDEGGALPQPPTVPTQRTAPSMD